MRLERAILLPAAPEKVWELIAQTDKFNREARLPPVAFAFHPLETGGSHVTASAAKGPLKVRYREHPFDWVRPHFAAVRRTFFGGPLREAIASFYLKPSAGGTLVTARAEVTPASLLLAPLCAGFIRQMVNDAASVIQGFKEFLMGDASSAYPRQSGQPPADSKRLKEAIRRTCASGGDPALSQKLAEHVAESPPYEASLIRPFELGDRWGIDRRELLEACLHAASGGLLDLRWRVLCPACRGAQGVLPSLVAVQESVHCPACNIRYDADFGRSVEVCFGVAPAIRPVENRTYCIGGPFTAPHAWAQLNLRGGESRDVTITAPEGEYAITSVHAAAPIALQVCVDAPCTACLEVRPGGSRLELGAASDPVQIAPGGTLEVRNRAERAIVLRIEATAWRGDIATASLVTTLQPFRDRFSSEVLSPGVELAVQQVAILFTDIRGSTALYRSIGDARSYRKVRDHFGFLREIIARHGGAVVKTGGDSVMAAFHDPAPALAAAMAIQRDSSDKLGGLILKIGLHWGPALAVNANGTLDYFGHTVNLAARLQHESSGGDLVLSAEAAADPQVQAILKGPGITIEPLHSVLRGIDEPVPMVRIHSHRQNERRVKKEIVIPSGHSSKHLERVWEWTCRV